MDHMFPVFHLNLSLWKFGARNYLLLRALQMISVPFQIVTIFFFEAACDQFASCVLDRIPCRSLHVGPTRGWWKSGAKMWLMSSWAKVLAPHGADHLKPSWQYCLGNGLSILNVSSESFCCSSIREPSFVCFEFYVYMFGEIAESYSHLLRTCTFTCQLGAS